MELQPEPVPQQGVSRVLPRGVLPRGVLPEQLGLPQQEPRLAQALQLAQEPQLAQVWEPQQELQLQERPERRRHHCHRPLGRGRRQPPRSRPPPQESLRSRQQ